MKSVPGSFHEKQRAYWDNRHDRRSPWHPAVRAFGEPKVDWLFSHLVGGPRISTLEVGCGNGFFSVPLAGTSTVTCLDFSRTMLAQNPVAEGRKIQGDARDLPFPDGSFDLVFCANLLHHLEEPRSAISEMARVAKKHVAVVEPNILNPLLAAFGLLKPEERRSLRFTPWYVKKLGRDCGLTVR